MKNTNGTTSGCPAWCIEEHDNLNPREHNIHMGPAHDLSHLFDPNIGEGTSTASIARTQMPNNASYYVGVTIDAELRADELDAFASEFERLAEAFRNAAELTK
jgi:hypothetical protein